MNIIWIVVPFYHILAELFPQTVQFNLSVLSDKLPKLIMSLSGLFFFRSVKFEHCPDCNCKPPNIKQIPLRVMYPHLSVESRYLSCFLVLVHFFVLLFGLPRWPSCRPRAARGCASSDVIKYLCTRHCWEEKNLFLLQRSTGKCPFGLLLTLVFIPFKFFRCWISVFFCLNREMRTSLACLVRSGGGTTLYLCV